MFKKVNFIFIFLLLFIFNSSNAYSEGYENVLWRHADLHEEGDLEPSDFIYIAIKGDWLLVRLEGAATPESYDIYKIISKDNNKFCAKIKESFLAEDGELKKTEESGSYQNICASFLGDSLSFDKWDGKLTKHDVGIECAFPESMLKKFGFK